MRLKAVFGLGCVLASLSTAVLADDPNDPAMRSAAARARDREIIRQLNLQELAMVQERDARYAQGWAAARGQRGGQGDADYAGAARDHQRAMSDYADQRAQYDRDMAAWRRQVAACRAGDYSACD